MQIFKRKNPDPQHTKAEFHHFFWLRLVNIIVIGLYLIGAFFIVAFVEQNVYRVIQSNELISLVKNKLPAEAIQFDKLDRVEKAWDKKHNPASITITRDPFSSPTSTPAESL